MNSDYFHEHLPSDLRMECHCCFAETGLFLILRHEESLIGNDRKINKCATAVGVVDVGSRYHDASEDKAD
jgi:hypothetical protein